MTDSAGYEPLAAEYAVRRSREIGVATVRAWARRLPHAAAVLDLGCGNGVPITQALAEEGLRVHGIDASPTMLAAFRARFPECPIVCEQVEHSTFFGRRFAGAVAWGLVFLLPPEAQSAVLHRVAAVLDPGGSFLFTAPSQVCRWDDVLTGRESVSLGADAYRAALAAAGLTLVAEHDDEGGNHYYEALKEAPAAA